jgi:Flp pilus assembly protein TadD
MPQVTLRQLLNQAVAHHQAGRLTEAEAIYRQILAAVPQEPNALHLYGLLLHSTGKLEMARDLIQRAVQLRPQQAAFRSNLGQLLAAMGREDEALLQLRRAHELRPESAEILNNLGQLLSLTGSVAEGIALLRKSIALLPNHAHTHNNLGNALRSIGEIDPAVESLQTAVKLAPQEPVFHSNLGNALQDAGKLDQAIASFNQAIAIKPTLAEAHNNLGTSLRMLGRLDESIAKYRDAIALQPDYAMPHFNLGLTLLLTGNFEEGWREAEWRWRVREHKLRADEYPIPLWNGADLDSRTILLHPEQGFGDAIQFARYAPLLSQRGARVLLACQPELRRLFQQIAGVERVLTTGDMLPPCDVRCPLLSLPRVFGTNLSNVPAMVPFLRADPELVPKWKDRLAGDGRKKIGLAWAGRPQHRQDRLRSIPLPSMLVLAQVPGTRLISLQKGPAAAHARETAAALSLDDWTAELSDFADTAALIDALDLVITVDTAVAHLAGAMGKPVWVLLPFVPDWRWLMDRSDSPWYPTMRLFRQGRIGDWETPIQRVVRALGEESPWSTSVSY